MAAAQQIPPRPTTTRRSATATAIAAVVVLAVLGWAPRSSPDADAPDEAASAAEGLVDRIEQRPVVQTPSASQPSTFLDRDASPSTDLGRLRAQYLPVWTSDFDWAFPPEACGTAWELDGIAEPAVGADIAVLGDFATAIALSVMRYEHQLSRALAEPSALSQLCVATASVGRARSAALEVLESHLAGGTRRAEPAAYPDGVRIVGVSPTDVLSVACVTPGYPAMVSVDGSVVEPAGARARLQAYLLSASAGLEDQVADLSYRVSDATHRPVADCSGLDGWTLEWEEHLNMWIEEGRLWAPLGATLHADAICQSPPPDGPDECPRDWPE